MAAATFGDNPHDDVAGARACGMRTAHYATGACVPSPVADVIVGDLGDLPERLARFLA